jgi:two-component system, OmpR family, KDP operon response regulator KdpE
MSPVLLTEGIDPESILVVEDDIELRDALVRTLGTICRSVRTASTLAGAIRECTLKAPDLVLLDLGLPDGDGADLLRRLREISDMPIIALSGRTEEEEIVALLDAGADDFIIKPCGAGELLARVRGQIRRAATSTAARSWARIVTGGVVIDLIAQRVVRHGEPQRLTPTEWALLRALILHPGRALSPRDLWDLVWGREFGDFATHVRVHITHLRRKVEPDPSVPRLIITEPGLGYRFVGPT